MAEIAEEAGLQPDDPLLEGASKLFGYLWRVAWENAPGTVEGDADALHDMRVAVRRLRSALQNFEGPKSAPLVAPHLRRELARWRRCLGRLGDALGAVRDHDVLDDYLKHYAKKRLKQPLDKLPGLAHFERALQTERAAAFAPLVKRSNRAQEPGALHENFARFALGLPAATTPALTLREASRLILPRRIDEALALAGTLADPADIIGQHELRKMLKRLRYSLEFFAPCFAAPVKSRVKSLTQLQDLLGEMHDRDVLDEKARAICAAPDATLPADVAAFLAYGRRRRRYLLGQTRKLWRELEAKQFFDKLRELGAA
jgi:CHAD domain-containing protein